ncbi:hypothetical protein L1887_56817 [Cichorium endivia]|nr:hypothetical protein L1887_56817 [Cichorium endivia]
MSGQEYVDISTIGINDAPVTPSPLPVSSDSATVSYWMATTPKHQLPASLDALPASSDVVIIGSGITGVSCAYHLINSLSESNRPISSITIVEARQFCTGATGRNGGHLTTASALSYDDIAANPAHLLGDDLASLSDEAIRQETGASVCDILNFETATADAIRGIIADEKAEEQVGFTDDANWHICVEQAEIDAYEAALCHAAEHADLKCYVDRVRRVSKEEVDRRMHNPAHIKAVYEIPGATLHPRNLVALIYARALRRATHHGITLNLVTDCPVTTISAASSSSVLTTTKGEITASYVVHATNGYASHLLPQLANPARAQAKVSITAINARASEHEPPSADGPLYIMGGGRQVATGREWGIADDSSLSKEVSTFLHPFLANIFPQSYGKDVRSEWSGIMGYTKSKDPLVGPVPGYKQGARQYIAAGYSGHGMTRAFGCAEVVAQMITAHAKGEAWANRVRFPECYLTQDAKAKVTETYAEKAVDPEEESAQGCCSVS